MISSLSRTTQHFLLLSCMLTSLWAPTSLSAGGGSAGEGGFAACVVVTLSEDTLLDFGAVEVGSPESQVITMTNVGQTGEVDVVFKTLLSPNMHGRLNLSPAAVTIPRAHSQDFVVEYDPINGSNHLSQEIQFHVQNPDCTLGGVGQEPTGQGPTIINIEATGTATTPPPPSITLSPSILDFGELDVDNPATLALSLEVSAPANSDPMTVSVTPDANPNPRLAFAPSTFPLGGGISSQVVIVTYAPTTTESLSELLRFTARLDVLPSVSSTEDLSVTGEVYNYFRFGVARPGFFVLAAIAEFYDVIDVTFLAEYYNNIGIGNDAATATFTLVDLSRGISWEVRGSDFGWSGEGDFGPNSVEIDLFNGSLQGHGDGQFTYWETSNESELPCGNICNPDQSLKFIIKTQ